MSKARARAPARHHPVARCLTPLALALLLAGLGAQEAVEVTAPTTPVPRAHRARLADLDGDAEAFRALRHAYRLRNPGHDLEHVRGLTVLGATDAMRVAFVQRGATTATVLDPVTSHPTRSPLGIGDLVLVRPGETLTLRPAAGCLIFTLPETVGAEAPSFVRPDWDPRITDTPGGCATETGAYRRVALTWLKKNGPYTFEGLNAHRVRITDSFTHYHPVEGGFDEFYLVQHVQAGACLLTSPHVDAIEQRTVTTAEAPDLFTRTPLAVGDLVYLPRGLIHRGVGGVLAHVITTPGFVPGSEIGVDHHLAAINARLGLQGDAALPLHAAGAEHPIVR